MLQVTRLQSGRWTVTVDMDPANYIAMSARTFREPGGHSFYRVGDFRTSLVEIPIDAESGIVRGLDVVMCDSIGSEPVTLECAIAREGLPVVVGAPRSGGTIDDERQVNATLSRGWFMVEWCGGRDVETICFCERLFFMVGSGMLLGGGLRQLTAAEVENMSEYAERIARRGTRMKRGSSHLKV